MAACRFFLVLLKAQNVHGWLLRLLLWSASKEMVLWEMTRFLEITFETDEIPSGCLSFFIDFRETGLGWVPGQHSQPVWDEVDPISQIFEVLCSQKVPRHHQLDPLHSPGALSSATKDRGLPGV